MSANLAFFAVVLMVGAATLWVLTKRKSRWGVVFSPKPCPECGTTPPRIRTPKGLEETMWGGWTCPNCGCKVDKYGRRRAA